MYLVRIKPSSLCDSYNEFFKSKGWHKVDEAKAEWCRTRRINDLSDDAPLVFDVKTQDEAAVIAVEEIKKDEPAGTPEAPIDFTKPIEAKAPEASTDGEGAVAGGSDEGPKQPRLRR